MWPIAVGKRRPEEWPESPEPLVPDTKDDVTEKRMRLRGIYDTRIAALGGAKLRPASPAGTAWKISFASSMPCAHAQCPCQGSRNIHAMPHTVACIQMHTFSSTPHRLFCMIKKLCKSAALLLMPCSVVV